MHRLSFLQFAESVCRIMVMVGAVDIRGPDWIKVQKSQVQI